MGYTSVRDSLERESLAPETYTGLWNVLDMSLFQRVSQSGNSLNSHPEFKALTNALWFDFFKWPLDTIPDLRASRVVDALRKWYMSALWYEVLDFVEFVAGRYSDANVGGRIRDGSNLILEREMAAYRFVGGYITEITSSDEIEAVETALNSVKQGPKTHLNAALTLLSDKSNPDYRNSIKESISAVEGVVNELAGTTNKSLGDALKKIDVPLHPALDSALNKLYGYTSDAQGIRHALMDEPDLDFADAKFMLVTCSAFVNLLLAKRAT
jgi:hypothetical protein